MTVRSVTVIRSAIAKGAVIDDQVAFDAYTDNQQMRGLSAMTIKHSRGELMLLAEFLRPQMVLTADHEILSKWALSLIGYGTASRYVKISRVHSFYMWAFGEEIIEKIPTRRIPRPKVPQMVPRPTPTDEVTRILARADGEMRLWIMLAALAGLRCCEIAQLSRDQIADTADPPHLRVRGKGNKERIVFLCDDLLAEIRAYPLPNRGWVFKRRDGLPGHPSPAMVSFYGNEYLHAAGVRETFHQLRHRFGTDIYAASDIVVTAALLGHSNIQTARGYARLSDAKAISAAQSLGLHPRPNEAA